MEDGHSVRGTPTLQGTSTEYRTNELLQICSGGLIKYFNGESGKYHIRRSRLVEMMTSIFSSVNIIVANDLTKW